MAETLRHMQALRSDHELVSAGIRAPPLRLANTSSDGDPVNMDQTLRSVILALVLVALTACTAAAPGIGAQKPQDNRTTMSPSGDSGGGGGGGGGY